MKNIHHNNNIQLSMTMPVKKLKGQIWPNVPTDKDEKDNDDGTHDDTAKIFLVAAIYTHTEFWSKHELSQSPQQRWGIYHCYTKKETNLLKSHG